MQSVSCAVALLAGAMLSVAAEAQHPTTGMAHPHGGIMYHAPHWSRDGRWILASANLDGDTEIFLVRADGAELRQLTRNTVADDIARFSDDGRRVLFQSDRSGTTAEYSMNLDGSDVRPAARDSVLSRSPDGKTLLFESVRDGRGRLLTMSGDRTNPREIATARHAEQGSFSPDGRSIVFEQRDAMHEEIQVSQIVVSRPDGSDPRVVATGTDPAWSRDGRLILFKTWDEPSQSLWISTVSPTGTGLVRLAPGVHPKWSPDDARIAFMSDRPDGGADIWVMNRDGSDAHCVTCRAPFR
jgi:Tol biopolymer transport system component